MKSQTRLIAVISGLLVGLGFRALAQVLKDKKPSRGKALLIALLICVLLTAASAFLWAVGLI
jgi:hypothetical protein